MSNISRPSAHLWIVYPCAQWRKEYPNLVPMFIWNSYRHAKQSRYDTGGFMMKVRFKHETPLQ